MDHSAYLWNQKDDDEKKYIIAAEKEPRFVPFEDRKPLNCDNINMDKFLQAGFSRLTENSNEVDYPNEGSNICAPCGLYCAGKITCQASKRGHAYK